MRREVYHDLYTELDDLRTKLTISIRQLRKNGTAYAEAERAYKIELRRVCLQLRDEGMAIGMIDKVCYGVQSVADKRFERDVALATWEANKEAINSIKLQCRLIEEQIKREWGTAEGA